MRVGADWLKTSTLPPVVIIGSGPAGVTLALRLAQHQVGSLVLEAGGESYSDESQDFYKGKVIGDHYHELDATRLRLFGGTSNHWAGLCRQLDVHDFHKRDDVPNTGWEIQRSDLDPYLPDAAEILEIAKFSDRPISEKLFYSFKRQSPPVNFATKYKDFFQSSKYAHLSLETPVVSIRANEGRITGLEVRLPDGSTIVLAPRIVVVCTGGIENSRLLLWSNRVSSSPVVAEDATLGRYWMDHPHFMVAEGNIDGPIIQVDEKYGLPFISPSADMIARYHVMNAALLILDSTRFPRPLIRRVACLVPPLAKTAYKFLGKSLSCGDRVWLVWEQAPDPSNRITLSETERDALGVPRPILHWRKSALDYRTPKVLLELLGRHLVRTNQGHVRANPFVIDEGGYPVTDAPTAHHHMGGTRMAATPRSGIVDRDLKIFGLSNGYIAGSSVFPTGGHANPTLTIVQLSLRLADTLTRRI